MPPYPPPPADRPPATQYSPSQSPAPPSNAKSVSSPQSADRTRKDFAAHPATSHHSKAREPQQKSQAQPRRRPPPAPPNSSRISIHSSSFTNRTSHPHIIVASQIFQPSSCFTSTIT